MGFSTHKKNNSIISSNLSGKQGKKFWSSSHLLTLSNTFLSLERTAGCEKDVLPVTVTKGTGGPSCAPLKGNDYNSNINTLIIMVYLLSIATMMLRKKQYCNRQNLSGTKWYRFMYLRSLWNLVNLSWLMSARVVHASEVSCSLDACSAALG